MAETFDHFRKLFEYDHWANQRALESIASAASQDEAVRLMGHIVGAHRTWLGRLASPPPAPATPWPKLSFAECAAAIVELHTAWGDLLSVMTSEKLSGNLVYRNTNGDVFTNPVAEVLTHVTIHAAYHRGQVAAAVRRGGGAPAATDYIAYVRQQAQSA